MPQEVKMTPAPFVDSFAFSKFRRSLTAKGAGKESPGTTEQDARENEQGVNFEKSAIENIPPKCANTGKVEIVW